MSSVVPRRGLVTAAAAGLLVAGVWAFGPQSHAAADVTTTTAVSAGPATFTQAVPTGTPSVYTTPLERCSHGVNYPLTGANPILSEPLTTSFTSNLPASVYVTYNGNQYYGLWQLVFTNTSTQAYSPDCALLVFRGPSGSDQHYYLNQEPTGHPQEDYLEVPRGDGTSFYIVRFGFHDVPYSQRLAYPGETFTYQFGGAPTSALTLANIRDSIRFTGDLDLTSNQAAVQHYGTNRLSN